MEKILKITLAILLLVCLLDMPYGYFQLVRFIAMIGFGYLAFKTYDSKKEISAFLYGALAILFQPILKISLSRDIWNVVDVIVTAGLIISSLKKSVK